MSFPECKSTPSPLELKFSISLTMHTYKKTKAAKSVKRHLNSMKTKEITAMLSEDIESYTRFMMDALRR